MSSANKKNILEPGEKPTEREEKAIWFVHPTEKSNLYKTKKYNIKGVFRLK